MKYTREDIFVRAKEAIMENNLFFIRDVIAFLPCSKTRFYELFDSEKDNSDTYKDELFGELVEMLEANKIKTKCDIRAKLYMGEKASELLALYRMICTPEERKEINQSYIDHTSNGNEIGAEYKQFFEENFKMGIK
jgi:hypothetical protein